MCDDLGYGDVGFNGSTSIRTPHLDRMAALGIVLSRFYTASPVCSPTRASCLTGRNPYRMGIPGANSGHLPKDEITLSEILHDEGYHIGHFGKWHLGTLTTKIRDANRGRPGDSTHYSIPSMHGYDEYFATESKVPTYDPMVKPVVFDTAEGESLRYGWHAVGEGEATEAYGTYYWDGEESQVSGGLSGDNSKVIMDRVLPFIKKASRRNQSFFATVWLHTPHLPVVADSLNMKAYEHLEQQLRIYAATITNMDAQIGRLDSLLQNLGLTENTMIWFCSDNGPEVRTPGSAGILRGRKRDLYEGGIRVPTFVRYPAKINPGISSFPSSTYDMFPTALHFLNIEPDKNRTLDGLNIAPALHNQIATRNKPMGFRYKDKTAWIMDTLKLISVDNGNSYELYNLRNDPQESINILDRNGRQAEEMKTQLSAWINDCDRDFADPVH